MRPRSASPLDNRHSARSRARGPRSRRPRRPSRRPLPGAARDRHPDGAEPTPALGSRKRCERRHAAEAVTAVERLGSRDLGPAAGKQVGAQRAAAGADGAGGEHRLDEVAARLVASLRAVGVVRVAGLRRREVVLLASRRAPSLALAAGGRSRTSRIASRRISTLYRDPARIRAPRRADVSRACPHALSGPVPDHIAALAPLAVRKYRSIDR